MTDPDVLWQRIAARLDAPPAWSWGDAGLGVLIALALLIFPEGLLLLAYHL